MMNAETHDGQGDFRQIHKLRQLSCLSQEEKKEAMDMLYRYKEAFSLRDEIGVCPNIEVEIDVPAKSPFFIRLYHITEEDKAFIDKDMK